MNSMAVIGKWWWKLFLILLKTYVLIGVFCLWPLIRLVGLDGDVAINLLTVGFALSFCVLAYAGMSQCHAGAQRDGRSSFIFAVGALFWIAIFKLLLPRLTST